MKYYKILFFPFSVLSLIASTLTLTMIACDRFFGIVFAIKSRVTKKRYKLFIISIWIIATVVSVPLLIHRKQFKREWADHVEIWSQDDLPLATGSVTMDTSIATSADTSQSWYPSRKMYYVVVTIALYFVPCVIMTLAYTFVMYTLWSKELPGECITTVIIAQQRKMKKVI